MMKKSFSEMSFKELKSTLGFHQYQFRSFDRVEAWCELVVAAFLYLEWYRATRLRRRGIPEAEKRKWRHQRTHGLCLAIRQASEQQQLRYIAERLKTDGGTRKLKRFIHDSFPEKYRMKT